MKSNRREIVANVFDNLNRDNIDSLDQFYHPDVTFIDPASRIEGLTSLKEYYRNMYQNVLEISFDYTSFVEQETNLVCIWVMKFRAKGLNSGREVLVHGTSHLIFDEESNLVKMHRDYFDLGELIYEYIPLLGSLIKKIKSKIGH